ncbi:putative primosome assembly protein PriA [Mycobacterium xenopi 4042]|uniref:Putative primosome assembly protein PriA n=1 Tax=Mycobacterium xenopi 4042 TaxID=1299334 RepID=X7YRA3_MYCXE|nr:putative primosome assembly protein PriA [Mycobacterium xenopi 4042]
MLVDAWALLGRQDLRAAEDTLRRWMAAAALVRSRRDGGWSPSSRNHRSPPSKR